MMETAMKDFVLVLLNVFLDSQKWEIKKINHDNGLVHDYNVVGWCRDDEPIV